MGTKLSTDPFQVSMSEVEAMKILQPMCNIYQLWKPVISIHVDTGVKAHKLDSIHVPVVPDELVDVTITHPL